MTTWATLVTTVPARRDTTLPRTLDSLRAAGFDPPAVLDDPPPHLGVFGTWLTGVAGLRVRHPTADLYAVFQDDVVLCAGVRDYLAVSANAAGCYYNLYAASSTASVRPPDGYRGWYSSPQTGRGALALVFPRDTLDRLLAEIFRGSLSRWYNTRLGRWFAADRVICEAARAAGLTELVHSPSLAQHADGGTSTLPGTRLPGRVAPDFPGEDWDARQLLLPGSEG